jgi:hypothetical protein
MLNMTSRLLPLLITIISMTSIPSLHAQNNAESKKVLRHVVMLKFKDNTTAENVKRVEASFTALAGKIKLIKDFEWGKNSSPENLNQGLTHCFLVTFSSNEDRDAYLVHPDHKAFVDLAGPFFDKVTVVDYWTEK